MGREDSHVLGDLMQSCGEQTVTLWSEQGSSELTSFMPIGYKATTCLASMPRWAESSGELDRAPVS